MTAIEAYSETNKLIKKEILESNKNSNIKVSQLDKPSLGSLGVKTDVNKIMGLDIWTNMKASDIIEYFNSVQKRKEYLAFEVFPNDLSFRAFNEAKNLATSMGVGYTWAPRKDDIGLTKNGKGAGREL